MGEEEGSKEAAEFLECCYDPVVSVQLCDHILVDRLY